MLCELNHDLQAGRHNKAESFLVNHCGRSEILQNPPAGFILGKLDGPTNEIVSTTYSAHRNLDSPAVRASTSAFLTGVKLLPSIEFQMPTTSPTVMQDVFGVKNHRVHAMSRPRRGLVINFELTSPFEYKIIGLDSRLSVKMDGGRIVAEGKLLKFATNVPHHYLLYEPHAEIRAEMQLELSGAMLRLIEDERGGRDVDFEIDGEIEYSIAHQIPNQGHWSMGERRLRPFYTSSGSYRVRISQSDWVRYLSQMGWEEIEIWEVPTANLDPSRMGRSIRLLREALNLLRHDHVSDCMAKCRKAFEAAVHDASQIEDFGKGIETLMQRVPASKRKEVDDLLRRLGAFTHLARHEGAEEVPLSRDDALLCLGLTRAAVEYVAKL